MTSRKTLFLVCSILYSTGVCSAPTPTNDAHQDTIKRIAHAQNAHSLSGVLREITDACILQSLSSEQQIDLVHHALMCTAPLVMHTYYEHLHSIHTALTYWQTLNTGKPSSLATIIPYFDARTEKTRFHEKKLRQLQGMVFQRIGNIDITAHTYPVDGTSDEQWSWCLSMAVLLEPSCRPQPPILTPVDALTKITAIVQSLPTQNSTLKKIMGKSAVPSYGPKTYASVACIAALGTYAAYRIHSQNSLLPNAVHEAISIAIKNPIYVIQNALDPSAPAEESLENKVLKILEPSITPERFNKVSHDTATRTVAHITSCYRILGVPELEIKRMLDEADAYNRISRGDHRIATGVFAELCRAISKHSVISSVMSKNAVIEHLVDLVSFIVEIADIKATHTHFALLEILSNNHPTITATRKWAQLMLGLTALAIIPYATVKVVQSLRSTTHYGADLTLQQAFFLLYDMEALVRNAKNTITPEIHGALLFYGHRLHTNAEKLPHEYAQRTKEVIASIAEQSRLQDSEGCIARIIMARSLFYEYHPFQTP